MAPGNVSPPRATTTIHEQFEAQATRSPDAIALVFEDKSLTYRELNAQANRLAHHLRAQGVGADALVGVCLDRSPDAIVAMLAVLKAGGAFVPIDPTYPTDRIAFMLADAGAPLVLTRRELRGGLPGGIGALICLDEEAPRIADRSDADPGLPSHGEALAYVIYTSGSTGQPKGVAVPHRGFANYMEWVRESLPLGADDAVLQKASFSFDCSVGEIWPPLLSGARLVLAPTGAQRDVAGLVACVRREKVTMLLLVPSMTRLMIEQGALDAMTSLRLVFSGAEALPLDVAKAFTQRSPARLVNVYGPTEATVSVTWWTCTEGATSVSVGKPIPKTRIELLDADMRRVPEGATGELYIGGVQLSRGYFRRPELTAERFVPDPFGAEPGGRLYRTGDLGRRTPDGDIELVGRADHQVKLRGFRVELSEVESKLAEHPGVRTAVAVLRQERNGDARLIAYVVADAPPDVSALRTSLLRSLPEYMVPSSFVTLDAMPLTPNGKIDRLALAAPDFTAPSREPAAVPAPTAPTADAPADPIEQRLLEILGELLEMEPAELKPEDRFLDLGMDSMMAMRLLGKLQREWSIEALSVDSALTNPSVRDMAGAVRAQLASSKPKVAPEVPSPLTTGPMLAKELPAFEQIQDVLYAQMLKHFYGFVPQGKTPGGRNTPRFEHPSARIMAIRDHDGALAGGGFIQVFGSRAIAGGSAIAAPYQRPYRADTWNVLLKSLCAAARDAGADVLDGVTFPQSVLHYEQCWEDGIPVFQAPFMAKPVRADHRPLQRAGRLSERSADERARAIAQMAAVTEAFWPGFRLDGDVTHVLDRGLGDVLVVEDDGRIAGFALCHHGPLSESFFLEQLLVKSAYVAPTVADPRRVFDALLDGVEGYAAERDLKMLGAMVSGGRRASLEALRAAQWKIEELHAQWLFAAKVPLQDLNDVAARSFRPEHFALAEWR